MKKKEHKRIVIAGGGFGGMQTYRHLKRLLGRRDDVTITIVDRTNYLLFTPMLHEAATGSVDFLQVTQPIRDILRKSDRYVQGEIVKIDPMKRVVMLADGASVSGDVLLVALGSEGATFGIPGVAENALQLKTLADAVRLRNTLINNAQRATQTSGAERKRFLCTVIVGGGWTGVEAAGQIADLQRNAFPKVFQSTKRDEYCIKLVDSRDRLLHFLDPRSSVQALRRLEKLGVEVILNEKVKRVAKDGIDFDGKHFDCGLVLWTSGVVSAASKFFDKKLLNEKKRIVIEPTFAVIGCDRVFAIGDCADVTQDRPSIPQSAQAATQGAPVLARNILSALKGGQFESFRFKKRGELVPIGDWYAVAEIGSLRFSGRFAWWLRRAVFLFGIFSWVDRIKIFVDWTLNIFMTRDTSEIH